MKNIQPTSSFVNEAGLYQLLSNSTKSIAKKFKEELFTDILPSIRKTGNYQITTEKNKKLKEIPDFIRVF